MDNFQLTTNTQGAADFWTQGGPTPPATQAIAPYAPPAAGYTGGPAAGAKLSPVVKAHRLLRGRYPVAIMLAAIGALVGGVGGWVALPPKFESTGLVMVNTTMPSLGVNDPITPMLTMFIAGQSGIIQSNAVASAALKDPAFINAWQKNYSTPLPSAADFIAAETVERAKGGSNLITIAFDDKKKEVAEAGCKALLAAYMQLHGSGDDFQDTKKVAYLTGDLKSLDATLTEYQTQLDKLQLKYGTTDLQQRDQAMQAQLTQQEAALEQAKVTLDAAINAANGHKVDTNTIDKESMYQTISAHDAIMAAYLRQRENDLLVIEEYKTRGLGDKAPMMLTAKGNYDAAQQRVEDYAHEYLARNPGMFAYSLPDEHGMPQNLDVLKQNVESMQKMVDDTRQKAMEIGTQRQQIQDTNQQIAETKLKRDNEMNTIQQIEAKLQLAQTIALADPGSEATLTNDKRKLVAGMGFGLGGLIPLGLMMLYGLTENRFRYSDEASTADLSGVTLLGILPNLPDRLSDPQQAGIAAHCVHQIRTMLQISAASDEPQVIAVTSASSGDGKTSLTLALGLSYAAAGARTLLIDCDLVAAGLTHRLNVNSADGVLESVANRALLEFVRTTDIADVAILPVGTTHAHHASTLSPVALRRLLSESKKHFDIIIVDTGPILGSIEASLVCAAADRTVLAVARNQQRPLVEKSISHLLSIGSSLAGVVFNRAHTKDFERSMSGLALRSRPATGTTGGQASAAKAVAGSFKRAG
jgi:capsular exopolysaccharide synthesis family protein